MMKRSQIYLSQEQWRLLSLLSHQSGQSISELIRKALVKTYQKDKEVDFEAALRQASGLWKNRKDLPPTESYIRSLRKDRGRLAH